MRSCPQIHPKLQLRWQRIQLQCRRSRFDPWSERSLGEGNVRPLQYSCLENSMDRGGSLSTILNCFLEFRFLIYKVTQSCPTFSNPVDCSPPGSSVHEIFQTRILEWVATSFSRGSSGPRDRTQVSCIGGRLFTI